MLCPIKPPPNASTAKSADNLATMGRPRAESTDRHVPDDAREDGSPPVRRDEEQSSGDEVGEGEEDERFPPANTVRDEADDERVECAAQHRQGQHNSDY